ncbi:DUF726 domain-containing protein [Thalassotalea agariperforans]
MRRDLKKLRSLYEENKKRKHLSVVADPELVKEQLEQDLDHELINTLNKQAKKFSSRMTESEFEEFMREYREELKSKGIEATDEIILRELACQTTRISDIENYKQLLWDPEKTVVGENTGIITRKISEVSPFGRLADFRIKKIKAGVGPAILVINGFLSQNSSEQGKDWLSSINASRYSESPVYLVEWDSGNVAKLFPDFKDEADSKVKQTINLFTEVAQVIALGWAKVLGTKATAFLHAWYTALIKSEQVGKYLSYIMQCTDHEGGFIIMGHSLGARVCFHTLKNLSEVKKTLVNEVYLLGGAITHSDNKSNWNSALSAVKGSVHNYYSEHDDVLRYMYKLGAASMSHKPIGLVPIADKKVINKDVSYDVKGHTEHKDRFSV